MHEFSAGAKTEFGDSPRILGEFLGQSPNSVALRDKNLCIVRARGSKSYLWVFLVLLLALEGSVPRLQAQEFDWGGSFRGYPFLRLEKLALEQEFGGRLSRRDTELLILRLTADGFLAST